MTTRIKESKKSLCIRSVSNFSKISPEFLIDQKAYDPDYLKLNIPNAAPKIEKLFNKIKELDENDLNTHNKLFKHMIFTDMQQAAYGAKILASSFVANGFIPAYNSPDASFSKKNDFTLKDLDKLEETEYSNFGLLISKPFYNKQMTTKFKKLQLESFNNRPDNTHGKHIRFMILDQGFKEGIDLFDIKYVHLIEPLLVKADEKQAIGRATRFCGQKGLEFQPNNGWPLYVYKYDVSINVIEDIDPKLDTGAPKKFTFDDLYKKYSTIDLSKMIFASELDTATQSAAVDYQLTKSVHEFILKGGSGLNKELILKNPPKRKMNIKTMSGFIRKNYKEFKYPPIKIENKCIDEKSTNNQISSSKLVTFSPTQEFVRNYFQPTSAYKGLLLYNGVGTGKTLTGIATATSSFEQEGYTILWVTRHTLKSDIWKNMFNQVGNVPLREKLRKGLELPENISNPMAYLSKNWMRPISYKQFSNMLLGKNEIYKEITKRNGTKDPLRKTLLIIDEAHKLYSPTVPIQERPNMKIFEKMIQNSYIKSRKNSVRVMLMTATPYTESPMEMIKLLNLFKLERFKFPAEFDDFKKIYLDEQGHFTNKGLIKYKNKISGYVSYLDRSNDVRFFAHPIIENILVPMTTTKLLKDDSLLDKKNNLTINIKNNQTINKEIKAAIKKYQRDIKNNQRDIKNNERDIKNNERVNKKIKGVLKNIDLAGDQSSFMELSPESSQVLVEEKIKLEERYSESIDYVESLKLEKQEVDGEIKKYKAEIKEFRTQNKWLKRELDAQFDNIKNAKKELSKQKVKIDKKNALLYYELQLATHKTIKADIIKNNIEIMLLKIKIGIIKENKLSQEKMLKVRCDVKATVI